MVGHKLALVLGILLISAVASESNNPKIDEIADIEEAHDAPAHLNNNAQKKKVHLSSALQTLVNRVLKTKDVGTNHDDTGRDLESRAWYTNMQKDNIFEEDFGPEPRAAGKPKSGKKKRRKKKQNKKKSGGGRRKNRGKGKGGRSRGRGKGAFSIGSRCCNSFHVVVQGT